MSDLDFLGKGMKFPPQVDKSTGRFKVSSGYDNIKESVYIILMTQVTERFMRPEFGSNVLSYTFVDLGPTMTSLMKRDIIEAIITNEPRITDVDVSVEDTDEDGKIIVTVTYTVTGEHRPDSLVFPFFKMGTEIVG
ncbi:MAG: GPW/gp25 family protein [Clostridia bacterium]|nr:GPW/gp25 family protein [Clostridia bacterium]